MTKQRLVGALAVATLAAAVGAYARAGEPTKCGGAKKRLRPEDVATIERLVSHKGAPCLIEVNEAHQVAPTLLLVRVYLCPHVSSSEFRRGSEVRLYRYLSEAGAPVDEWQVQPETFEYAQVRRSRSDRRRPCDLPRGWARPFEVVGRVSDDDIVSVLKLVKSSPSRSSATTNPDGSTSFEVWSVEGKNVVVRIEAKGDSRIEVRTVGGSGSGQLIELEKAMTGEWMIVRVWESNA